MKCPSCGAESQGKFCEYCGSEMPKETPVVNITNNYYGQNASATTPTNSSVGGCPKCGHNRITFKRERISTVTQSASHKNFTGTGRKGQSVSQSAYRTVGVCQNCGYTWNPNASSSAKKNTWLWVLGWIFIFPIPLTILLLRKKDMKPTLKYSIIAVAWILFLIIAISGNSDDSTPNDNSLQTETTQVSQITNNVDETTETIEDSGPYAKQEKTIKRFVSEFNTISNTPITDIDFRNNHTIAYLVVDGFSDLSIKVNDNSELGFIFTFEFKDGKSSLEKYEDFMSDVVRVFDANIDVEEKFQEANTNQNTTIYLSDSIFIEYNYIEDAVGFQAADTYIITLTSTDYNK